MATIKKVSRPWMKKKVSYVEKISDPFYNSTAWRKCRKSFMSNPENRLCRHCSERELTTLATECDHVTPIRLGGERFDHANLQGLCRSCHAVKSAKERGT